MSNDLGDFQNLALNAPPKEMDRVNAHFYGKFPYPWRPQRIERPLDPDFERLTLCQSLGDWQHVAIPRYPNIWVAGCGTNQSVLTALNFPEASVVGSDLSQPSLDLSARTVTELSIKNLQLRCESINEAAYKDQFDYILCTGVIHHNADPAQALRKISTALKPNGILELMVYNRFHRIFTSSFQNAIRLISGRRQPGDALEIALTGTLIKDFPTPCLMKEFLSDFREAPIAAVADSLMQPIEYSYTVESLQALARSCGLEIYHPCINQFDRSNGHWRWNLNLRDPLAKVQYNQLDDLTRWQVTNLLLCESSPMLWFYLKRRDTGAVRSSELEICETFLDTVFTKSQTFRQVYELGSNGTFRPSFGKAMYPSSRWHGDHSKIVDLADGQIPMRKILEGLCLPDNFLEINEIRLQLTTSAFPYLISSQ